MFDLSYLQTHRGEKVRIYDLLKGEPTREGATLDGHDFEDCDIGGPAMVVLAENVDMNGCTFDERPDMFLIELDPGLHPQGIVGAIALRNCRFHNCRFKLVGLLGDTRTIAEFRKGFGG